MIAPSSRENVRLVAWLRGANFKCFTTSTITLKQSTHFISLLPGGGSLGVFHFEIEVLDGFLCVKLINFVKAICSMYKRILTDFMQSFCLGRGCLRFFY